MFDLNVPQTRFLAMPHKFRAFVAGYGSGKSWVGGAAQCAGFHTHPRINQGYFAPTYGHIRDIFFPTIEEVAENWGLRVETREANKEVHFYEGRQYRGTTICRSMDDPGNIVGFKIGRAMIDELDVLKKDHARQAWRKIIARMRYKDAPNQVDVTTTPEGFRFTYERFVSSLRESPELRGQYGMVQASTLENRKNLPDDYIPSLMQDYPEALRDAYIRGQFVNLTQGSVYPSFSRTRNATNALIEPGEDLHIGMDFNVGKMAAVIHVIRSGKPMALAERCKVLDTPAMIDVLLRDFPGHHITVYPDASGQARKTNNASESDHSLLYSAGFDVAVDPTNPAVRDRVLAMNRQFEQGYLVNVEECPTYAEGLEQQAYNDKGEPDKTGGFDHSNDAGGYFICQRYPIPARAVQRIRMGGA